MFDLYLDPYTNDLVIENDDFKTTTTLAESLRQRLSITLKTWQGEWFQDTTYGTPYIQSILGKPRTQEEVDAIFLSIIGEYNAEILSVNSFNSNFDRRTRNFDLDFDVTALDGSTLSFGTPLPRDEEIYPDPVDTTITPVCPVNIPFVVECGNWLAHAAMDDFRVQSGNYFTSDSGEIPNIPYGYATESGEPFTESGETIMESGTFNDVTPDS
jgi:hypothetical protein